jgi:hypothetical protein
VSRILMFLVSIAALAASPARAQIFWQAPLLSGPPLLTAEPGYGTVLPGATTAEQKAALLWNLRSGLNVAALQCGFEPSLRVLENYNGILTNHREELQASFDVLSAYFKRTSKTVKLGQTALDRFGTRNYSSFSSVSGQLAFCTVAARISTAALFAPRGKMVMVAQDRLRELYNAVKTRMGEQQFRQVRFVRPFLLPRLDESCWKKNKYISSCGWQS